LFFGTGDPRRSGRVQMWDPTRPGTTATDLGHPPIERDVRDEVKVMAVLPDGRIATGGGNRGGIFGLGANGWLQVWDPSRPDTTPIELGPVYRPQSVAVLPNGTIATVTFGRIQVWDPARPGAAPTKLGSAPAGGVNVIAVLPDGRIVSDSGGGRIRVWDPARPGAAPAKLGSAPAGRVNAIAVLPDERIVTGGGDKTGRVQVWDPTRSDSTPIELGLANTRIDTPIQAVAVLPDGRIVTARNLVLAAVVLYGGLVEVWDPTRPDTGPIAMWPADSGRADAIAVLRGGRVATVIGGGIVILDLSAPESAVYVTCDAQGLVAAGPAAGGVDFVVLHTDGRALSGWSIPLPSTTHRE
jgi:cytochrome c